MKTDCLALLRTAEGGASRTVAASEPLARIWTTIASGLDDEIGQLNEVLVWMPAHQSIAMVGERKLSDGSRLSTVDWRANRLVDSLAKQAAAERELPRAAARLLDSAAAAVRHAATLLGRVTHGANNLELQVVDEDGTVTKRVLRDARPRPSGHKRKAMVQPTGPQRPCQPSSSTSPAVQPWQPSSGNLGALPLGVWPWCSYETEQGNGLH